MSAARPRAAGAVALVLAAACALAARERNRCAPRAADWPPAPPLEMPAERDAGPLPPSVRAEPGAGGSFTVRFTLLADLPAEDAFLAGDFNGWDPSALPMRRGADGRLRATVRLAPGRHLYKFVLGGGRWIEDPANPEREDDGHGGYNSVLRLGRAARLERSAARLGDGAIEPAALAFDPRSSLFLQRLGDGRWLVRYRTLAGDVERVWLCLRGAEPLPMARLAAGPQDLKDTWEALVPAPAEPVPFTFLLEDGATRVSDPHVQRLDPRARPPFTTPDWAKDATWYQIFPDRFRNGDPSNDPRPVRPWTSEWLTPSAWEEASGQSFYRWYVFERHYGGDLAGIEQGFDHLEALGVSAIYLNPIFRARSNHRYDAASWIHVDEELGAGETPEPEREAREDLRDPSTWTWTESDRRFLEFLRRAHARGFRVILDGVFNHVGKAFPAYRDLERRGRASPYADWFEVRSFEPLEVAGWAGFDELPVFRKGPDGFASPQVERLVFDVTRRWMDPDGDGDPSDGIDGWRLDVPNEIPRPFWERWRRHVKAINPDAYLSGEIWYRADDWLDGTTFDAVMNYPFARAVIGWVADRERKLAPSELDRRLAELRLAYPAEATYVLQNLAGSHDTDRLCSRMRNPDLEFDSGNRIQDGAPYDDGKPTPLDYARARLVALVQATYVGAPMIYYGDEVGMWGADDPSNRKPMLWRDLEPYARPAENHVERRQLAWYREVFSLRRAHSALRRGSFRTLLADDERDLWAFLREDERERVVVLLNASERPARVVLHELDAGFTSWLGGAGEDRPLPGGGREVLVPAIGGRVWGRPR